MVDSGALISYSVLLLIFLSKALHLLFIVIWIPVARVLYEQFSQDRLSIFMFMDTMN